jgi:hypothetical protein
VSAREITDAAAGLLTEYGDVRSAERAAGARTQTACNTAERGFWSAVRLLLAATEDARTAAG